MSSRQRAHKATTRANRQARRPREQTHEPQTLDEQTGLPTHLVEAVRASAGPLADTIIAGWGQERPVTMRVNTLRSSLADVTRELDEAGIGYARVPWYADALVLADNVRERDVWGLNAYAQGKVYLQSLSSMLPPLALRPQPGTDVLDMCAAPGGKTSELAALAPARGGVRAARVTACELSAPRAEKLEHNLAKLGATNVQVMRVDARRLDDWFSFDQVLLDAPCTGSGTVSLHDGHAARYLTPELANRVERSQRALLDRGLTVLKAGGSLVYSTCSILPRENEDVVEWALARHADCELVDVALPHAVAGEDTDDEAPLALPNRLPGTLTVCPSRLFEGFFVSRIAKRG